MHLQIEPIYIGFSWDAVASDSTVVMLDNVREAVRGELQIFHANVFVDNNLVREWRLLIG